MRNHATENWHINRSYGKDETEVTIRGEAHGPIICMLPPEVTLHDPAAIQWAAKTPIIWKATANLLASAPEAIDACDAVLCYGESLLSGTSEEQNTARVEMIAAARRAVSKAHDANEYVASVCENEESDK